MVEEDSSKSVDNSSIDFLIFFYSKKTIVIFPNFPIFISLWRRQISQTNLTNKQAMVNNKQVPSQQAEILMPSYSAWYKGEEVNDIEKAALPEFFNGRNKSKTSQIYKDYRDFMIHTYRYVRGSLFNLLGSVHTMTLI
jgi:hypothetical protein